MGHVLLIVALLTATGGHWYLLQTVAWSSMLATNLQEGTLTEALSKTFYGNHPCSLCKQIAKGKASEKKSKFPTPTQKLEFTHAPSRFVFAPPMEFWLQGDLWPHTDSLTHAPPVPPPRAFSV